ncbi:hypothetical protein FB45DRAFT_222278 [Roridomyces roridus]|uniref:DUF1793-domain-containing protein n=1 Tax=Roridomyces roridus TaxID=1738132 RepID=A0AAD7BC57_9AGAR|nr:hypothetical protein FB45DRAFT_222278 [Roridomyces roridus]
MPLPSPRSFLWLSIAFLQLWSSWPLVVLAQPQSFFPPSIPLAVRSPTLSCWLDTWNGTNPMNNWPNFWSDTHILGWAGLIKVDGQTFHWLGDPTVGNASTWLSTTITPTRTILTVQAGPMILNVTFLSPVEPSDWSRQSFPFSYMYVDGQTTDGNSHNVQLYSDISAEWVTDSLTTPITFGTTMVGSTTQYHQVQSSTPKSVFQDVAEDGTAYYAVQSAQPGLKSVIGNDQTLRPQFAAPGQGFNLATDIAGSFGTVRDSGSGKFPVFAHAVDLGQTNTISRVSWAVGLVRDPVVTYLGTERRAYFWSQYPNISVAIDAFVQDFPSALTRALALEQQILTDAGAVSAAYTDLVSLATRQVMAGVEITLPPQGSDGSWNFSDVQAFMKDVGATQRVNPTETIYAALPALLYFNSSLAGMLLEPMLRYQASADYTNPFATPDLGLSYPSAPGDASNDDVIYGVENSGNMLIMALAQARTSGDGTLIKKYYPLLKGWANYLVSNALIPSTQQVLFPLPSNESLITCRNPADARDSTLAQNHGNVTNLALKGLIGIQAMFEISSLVSETADAQEYAANATSLIQSWVAMTSSSGNLLSTYGSSTSGGLMYNMFADKLLKTNILPASAYSQESTTLAKTTLQATFGFVLNSESGGNTRSDWTLFSAAAAPDTTTRDLLISGVHKRASNNVTQGPFSNIYSAQTGLGEAAGTYPNGFASPAQGAMFSLLSLNVANKTVVFPVPGSGTAPGLSSGGGGNGGSSSSSHRSNTGAIAGGIIAGAFAIFAIGVIIIFMRRRRRATAAEKAISAPQAYNSRLGAPALMSELSSPPVQASEFYPTGPNASSPPPQQPYVPMPVRSKGARGETLQSSVMLPDLPASPPASQAPTWVSGTSGRSRVTASASGSGSGSTSPTTDLRTEMASLRREVEQLRAERDIPTEAPPEYQ